jgi:hypothetical protein
MPNRNQTHRTRLARAYADLANLRYMDALRAVNDAAAQGLLPPRLDEQGMRAGLRVLTIMGATKTTHHPSQQPNATTPATVEATRNATPPVPRQATDPRDQPIYDSCAVYEGLTGKPGLSYISSPGNGERDRYVFADGFVGLGRAEALTHASTLAHDAVTHHRFRNPYVGEGADGARRSAEIDRTEADHLDATDPRRPEVLASAEQWDAQARLLDLRDRTIPTHT